jgi:hypothetical protein
MTMKSFDERRSIFYTVMYVDTDLKIPVITTLKFLRRHSGRLEFKNLGSDDVESVDENDTHLLKSLTEVFAELRHLSESEQ